MNYKAPDNTLHFLEDDSFAHLLPLGSVPITQEEADAIRAANMPKPTHAELAAEALRWARATRLEFFKVLDGLQVSALVTNDTATAQSIETAKQALRDITATVDLSGLNTLEEMQQAFVYAYWQIRATVPENVQSAFNALVP